MTSSLVGSEMCIRDSLQGEGGAMLKRPETEERGHKVMSQDGKQRQSIFCLLYTSDAADDM
eukprot:7060905-Prorocentrum_lima.AAC.1